MQNQKSKSTSPLRFALPLSIKWRGVSELVEGGVRITLIILLLFLALSPAIAESGSLADPMRIGVGARSMGMGKAYVGLAEDGDALFLNPAGIAKTANLKISSMYSKLLSDIDYTVLGGVYPLKDSALGVGFILSQSGDIVLRDKSGLDKGSAAWNAQVLSLVYATKLNQIFKKLGDKEVYLGGNLKYFKNWISGDYQTEDLGFDLDLALLYPLSSNLTLGLNAQNILPATMSQSKDEIPVNIKFGGKATFAQKLNLLVDLDFEKSGMYPHFGAEYFPTSNLALRLGSDAGDLTAGVGIRFFGIDFNYAYHPYANISENTTHYFSLGWSKN